MNLTVDIIEEFISNLTLLITVDSFSDDGTNTTLEVSDTFHVRKGMIVKIANVSYTVISVEFDTNIVIPGVVANPQLITVDPPFYYHGTPLAIADRIKNKKEVDKFPMIYLYEVLRENEPDINSRIVRESELRLFFLDTANYQDWDTEDFYQNRLKGLNSFADIFIESAKNYSAFYLDETDFSRKNHNKWGKFIDRKGHEKNTFNDKLTAVELTFTLPIRDCGEKKVFSILTIPQTWEEMVAALGRGYNFPANFATTSYRTGDDAWQAQNIFTPAVLAAETLKARNIFASHYILANDNKFGNTNRYTDDLGGQVYANNYVIDHYTGLAWYNVEQVDANRNNAITNSLGTDYPTGLNSTLGFTDWVLPSVNQAYFICDPSLNAIYNSVINIGATIHYTSTTSPQSSSQANVVRDRNIIGTSSIGVLEGYIFCRKHF